MTFQRVAVIGTGPAAISAVLWLERLGQSVLWIGESEVGGSLRKAFNPILDFPPQAFENGAELSKSLAQFTKTLKTQTLGLRVNAVHRVHGEFEVVCDDHVYRVASVILATGTSYRRLHLSNEDEFEGRVLFRSCSRYKDDFTGKDVLVVGGGDAAFEGALLLHGGGAKPTIVVRRTPRSRESFSTHVDEAAIPILTHSRITALNPHPDGCLVSLDVDGVHEERLVSAVFVRIGVTPNTPEIPEVLRDDEGYLVVDSGMETSVPGLFAAGDVRSTPLRSVSTAMGDGALAAASAHASITSKTC